MAIVYHFDLYPRLDPVHGSRIVRFTKLQAASYRGEANGTGSGQFTIRASESEAANIDPLGMQYVRVVRDNAGSEKVVGGFFLEQGDFAALTETSIKKLTFGGAGALSYLARAVAGPAEYIPAELADAFKEPRDGLWHWYYSPAGSILSRMIEEAQDSHRPQQPIPDVTRTFTRVEDTGLHTWPGYGDHWLFTAQVGETVLSITKRLMEAGLYVSMDPDTFELSAWMQDGHGRDRTGGAWGSSVVRFQAPSAGTVATGNIKSEAKRGIAALVKRSDLLVGGNNSFVWVNDPAADIVWEGSYFVDDPDGTSLPLIGAVQLAARSDAGDTVRLRMKLGNSPTTGEYLPFEHVQLDDHVTLHTGSGEWDWNESEQKVSAITLQLRDAGDWDAFVDLGSTYSSIENRQFQVVSTGQPGCTCIKLCDPDWNWIQTDTSWRVLNVKGITPPTGWNEPGFDDSDWVAAAATDASPYVLNMVGEPGSYVGFTRVPSDEIVVRKEYMLDEADLTGADVVFKYALDNGGYIYVNGVLVASLTPLFELHSTYYTSDHATTIPRSAFQIGLNCVAIYVTNDADGSTGAIPPGPTTGGLYIELPSHNIDGSDPRAARCDHHHRHTDLEGRDAPEQHPATAVTETTYGDVQSAIDALVAGSGSAGQADIYRRHLHGLFLGAYHRDADEKIVLMTSADGITFSDLVEDLASGATMRDSSIIHFDGAYWLVGTRGGTTSFGLRTKADLAAPWTNIGPVLVDTGNTNTWAPEWVRNMDGTPYLDPATGLPSVVVACSTDSTTTFKIFELHPTNRAMTAWSSPVEVTGSGLPSKMIDPFLLVDEGTFYLWYKQETNHWIEYATSTTDLTSGYAVIESGDWAGWSAAKDAGANSIEGPCLIRIDDERWRIYFNENNGLNSIRAVYSESTDGWATWSTQASIVTDALMGHGSVIFIPGMYDHQRDPDAHPGLVGAGAGALADLSDVNLTSPDEDEVLTFDGSVWVNRAPRRTEVLMTTGITDPPDPLLSSDGTDWLYGEV